MLRRVTRPTDAELAYNRYVYVPSLSEICTDVSCLRAYMRTNRYRRLSRAAKRRVRRTLANRLRQRFRRTARHRYLSDDWRRFW